MKWKHRTLRLQVAAFNMTCILLACRVLNKQLQSAIVVWIYSKELPSTQRAWRHVDVISLLKQLKSAESGNFPNNFVSALTRYTQICPGNVLAPVMLIKAFPLSPVVRWYLCSLMFLGHPRQNQLSFHSKFYKTVELTPECLLYCFCSAY